MQDLHPIIRGGVAGGIFGIGEAPDLQPEGGSGDGGTIGAGLVERRLRTHPQQQQGLRCPRCDSPNTKFCYYNNYNLSQPRHYCKSCRRYWTKGGVLRNVPVGGGCRKSKRSSSSSSSSKSSRSSNAKHHDQQHHRRRPTAAAANSRSSSDSSSSITVASASATDASDGPLNAEPLPDKLVDANSLTIMKSADEAAPADDAFSVDGAAENLVDGSACSGSADQNQVECFFDYGFSDLSLPGASGMGFMDQTVLHGSDDVDWQLGGLSGNGAGFFDLAGNGGAVDNVGGFWNHGQWAEAVDVDPSLYLP